jgi:murein DD-endopeptidase MepM/ murein hydrolase activator NlpD
MKFVGWWEIVFYTRGGQVEDVEDVIEHIQADGRFEAYRKGVRIGAGRHVEFQTDPAGFTNIQEDLQSHEVIGRELVIYRLNEAVEQTGVQIGDLFFPAFQQDSGDYVSLFAYPYNMPESEFVPRILAVDLAGNERQAGFYYRANNKKFRHRKINLSKSFLQQKTPEFEPLVPQVGEPIDTFLYVNREIRKQNREKMVELARQTASTPLWQGRFLRMPRASELAYFADHRSYFYQGKKVDEAVHLGYDLASVALAEVPAANDGEVIWADFLGIYGLCVVIDHGLGLQTLYAHMSQLDVAPGDMVVKGQNLGRSGATGMAGGDHLHYGVFVSGVAVQPLEWWDSSWLENNISSKLELK